jgi:4-hydroxy 2-oxovalerate aldolase
MAVTNARIRILDATLRDGSHTVHHQRSVEHVRNVARRLDNAGVDAIGVGHGDGIGGSSLHFGKSLCEDAELLQAAAEVVENATIAVSLIPGVGVKEQLQVAWDCGARRARIATHATEADISLQHTALAREIGFEVHGDLTMPHLTSAAELSRQATLMVDAGAEGVHVVDSAGTLTPAEVRERIDAFLDSFGDRAAAGIHAHDNFGLAVANTLAAAEAGATLADACLAGLGAGAGNCRLEVLAAVMEREGFENRLDLLTLQDAALFVDAELAPPSRPKIDQLPLNLASAGVPSSFQTHIESAARDFEIDPRLLIEELGRRGTVSSQEDLILLIAAEVAERPLEVRTGRGNLD